MDERERVKNFIENLNRSLKDDLLSKAILKIFNIPNIDELEKRIKLIENSNYDLDLTRELLGDININSILNLCLVYLQTIIRKLTKIESR